MKVLTSTDNEDNGYHDSYFYSVYFDFEKEQFIKHQTHTTAGAGYNPVPSECMPLESLTDADKQEYLCLANAVARNLIDDSTTVFKGDIVQVVKGRKYPKGLEFTVTGRSEYKDKFGRIQTQYLLGEDGIKVSVANCKVLRRAHNEDHIEDIVSSLAFRYNASLSLSWFSRH
tara:strand:+ start:8048 stop:8563 length:516 start_codon:yes stop_codon:yes gene_type:complete